MTRENWIDVMKGLGIISVVAGHCYSGLISKIIFSFHMPLFFFLGGYLFRVRSKKRDYLMDKSIHLLLPYFIFSLLFYYPLALPDFTHLTLKKLIIYLAGPFIGGRILKGFTGVFWFITCYFVVQQLTNFYLNRMSLMITNLTVLGMLLLSYINSVFFPEFWLPWNANVVLIALPIFYLGYLLKRFNIYIPFIIVFPLAIISFYSVVKLENNFFDMKHSIYGIPGLTFLTSIIIILFIKKLSELIVKINFIAYPFQEFGKASMLILYLHQPVQLFCKRNFNWSITSRFILALLFPFILYVMFNKNNITRALLLGSNEDYKAIKNNLSGILKPKNNSK